MGFTLPRTLHVVAELGIADALEDAPQSAADLTAATGTHAGALNRALQLLATHGVFKKCGETYTYTPASRLLRSDNPQSMRPCPHAGNSRPVAYVGVSGPFSENRPFGGGEDHAQRRLLGIFCENPEDSALFNAAMTGKSHGRTVGILPAYDFSGLRSMADLGGGNGHLLKAVLAATPQLQASCSTCRKKRSRQQPPLPAV